MDISALTASGTAQTTNASSQLTANFDTFLTLLTTQLRNQDPLEPLDTERFTEQLVQFAGVEQSIQTNQNLEALIGLQSAAANETALSAIGRIATVNADSAALTAEPARWSVSLGAQAENAVAQIIDAQGNIAATLELSPRTGAQNVIWDGETSTGERAAVGEYRLTVIASDANGAAVPAQITSRGLVNAVVFNDGAPEVEIAGQRFALDLISRIDVDF
ncbi:MAG: flagellar hook capping FlgD N-terminal domain-containing protein [Pseudomonadota bacterium]